MDESNAFPWDRQPGEPHRWFTRFTAFRLLGTGRSLNQAVNAEKVAKGRKESRQAPGSWRNAARAWNWIQRAQGWDRYLASQAEAELEAKWRAQWMGSTELLGRLGEMERSNPYPFFVNKTVTRYDDDGHPYEVETHDFDWETVEKYGHLIKKLGWDRNGNPSLELQDKVQVARLIGTNLGLFKEQMDVTSGGKPLDARSLSDEELAAIAAGSGGGAAE